MSKSLYVTSAEGRSGKSTIALGVLETLMRSTPRVGVFRPITQSLAVRDRVLEMLLDVASTDIPYEDCVGVTYEAVHTDAERALSDIVAKFAAVKARCDAVVVIGSDFTDVATPTELSFNARVAANLGTPVLLTLGGRAADDTESTLGQATPRPASELAQLTETCLHELAEEHAALLAVVVNRADPNQLDAIHQAVAGALSASTSSHASNDIPVWVVPEDRVLVAPSVQRVLEAVDGVLVRGNPELLAREALDITVAGMNLEHVVPRLTEGSVIVVAADRAELLLAVTMAHETASFPTISAVVLNGGFELPASIERLLDGVGSQLPVIRTDFSTYKTAQRIAGSRGLLAADSPRKFDIARALFSEYVDGEQLTGLLELHTADIVTPLMFTHTLFERAKAYDAHIVLPEGNDDRVLRAASSLLTRGIVRLTILGNENEIRQRASELGLTLEDARVIDPKTSDLLDRFAQEYAEIRVHKGLTLDVAREKMTDVSYFGTMMVHLGLADGMVSGAAHTTAHTIKPSFEIIRTKPGVSIVSSVFFMLLSDRVLVYGDCAINTQPTATELADIAISSAETAVQFGVEPRVAMLSYSTGTSGTGEDVELVREATRLVRERKSDLLVEGPIQYDAASDPGVAATKLPDSKVAGHATVFIFPDLNTGNNTYKAVQRSAGALAVGPVLQGLNKPVNDLSRGALVDDILSTVAITAIQAGMNRAETTV